MENPLIAGFAEIKHEPKTWAWSGKTTEGQASPGLEFLIGVDLNLQLK